jgi:hypothetical protein
MIDATSDKSPGGGELPVFVRQRQRAPTNLKNQNKSVPRTRKENCHTRRLPCRNCRVLSLCEAPLSWFHPCLRPFRHQNGVGRYPSRLTFLTSAVRNVRRAVGQTSPQARDVTPSNASARALSVIRGLHGAAAGARRWSERQINFEVTPSAGIGIRAVLVRKSLTVRR